MDRPSTTSPSSRSRRSRCSGAASTTASTATRPGFLQKEDIHGRNYRGLNYFQYATQVGIPPARTGNPNKLLTIPNLDLQSLGSDALDTLKFENELRELYADIKFRGIPLTIRGGRQQIVWGETDDFRMLDRINSLNLTWHLAQEIPPPAFGWDEIRRPFWMIKFLYDLGNVWKFSQSFLEWYWNPGDWVPAKLAFLPRPVGPALLQPAHQPGGRRLLRRAVRPLEVQGDVAARAPGSPCACGCSTAPRSSSRATTAAIRWTTARWACATTASRRSGSSSP